MQVKIITQHPHNAADKHVAEFCGFGDGLIQTLNGFASGMQVSHLSTLVFDKMIVASGSGRTVIEFIRSLTLESK